ncbi:DSPc domain-containing protein, partial [Trichostrongylus colubriformis]
GRASAHGDIAESGRTGPPEDQDEGTAVCSPPPLERQKTAPSLPLATRLLYVGELVWQIDDTVFVGSQDAVANMNLLCRLNIEFVCDLCNEDGEEVNRRRYDCPCLCPRRSQHFRYFVAMDVPETEKKCIDSKINMTVLFDQFCDLVERGRKAGKSVLVCSAKGRNRAPAFCAAYLISKERMNRQQAVAKVLEQVNNHFKYYFFWNCHRPSSELQRRFCYYFKKQRTSPDNES